MRLQSLPAKVLLGVAIISLALLASCDEEDPNPIVSFAETNVSFDESDGSVGIDVVLTRAVSKDIVVKYILSGSAKQGTTASSDYSIDNVGELTIAQGQVTGTITLELNDDFLVEGSETITITINDVDDGIDIGVDSEAEVEITDNDHIPTEGLVSHYNFKGNSSDQAGASNGTDHNVNYPIVDGDTVLNIAGTDHYVELGDDFDFEAKTITTRFYAKTSGDGLRVIFSSDHMNLSFGSSLLYVVEESGQIVLHFNFSGNEFTQVVTASTWYHAAMKRSGKSFAYYINGEKVYSGTFADYNSAGNGVDVATVGTSRVIDRFFFGYIDDLRIYDRALTDDEIKVIADND